MAYAPRFHVAIHENLPGGNILPHGTAGFGHAAALDLARGVTWDTDAVPPSIEACKAIPARARPAAWQGRLVSPGLPAAFERFAGRAEAWGGADRLAMHFSVLASAERVAAHAAWLRRTVAAARTVPWPRGGFVSLALTGETLPADDALPLLQEPFAFATARARFEGVDPRELADFAREGNCVRRRGIAAEFLSLCLRSPELWFMNVTDLETAALAWLANGDFVALEAAVARWNALQDISPIVADLSSVALAPGVPGRAEALSWCMDHARKSHALVAAIRG